MSIARARYFRSHLTPHEARLWIRLRDLRRIGLHFRRQVPIEGYYVDFACLKHKLAIEIDGSQHAMPDGIQHDLIREERLKAAGLRIMRFWNLDIDQNLNGVVDAILIEIDPRLVGDVRRT